ncbi:MAG TPA: hypothetical protein DCE07_08310 [Peptococcaceae bacterium]|nr:hypothetical protein [Peptococcaceae bacterium]
MFQGITQKFLRIRINSGLEDIMAGSNVFIDTSAFIALASRRDQLHSRAVAIYQELLQQGVRTAPPDPGCFHF